MGIPETYLEERDRTVCLDASVLEARSEDKDLRLSNLDNVPRLSWNWIDGLLYNVLSNGLEIKAGCIPYVDPSGISHVSSRARSLQPSALARFSEAE